jgi:hypothetical protein
MAGSLSDVGENEILDHLLGTGAFTSPTNIYCRLTKTAAATDASSGTEVNGTGYSAQTATFSAASGGATANTGDVDYGTVGAGGWGSVYSVTLHDAVTAGTYIAWSDLSGAPITLNENDTFKIPTGDLDVSLQ